MGCGHYPLDDLAARMIALVDTVRKVVQAKAKIQRDGNKRQLKVLVFSEDGYVSRV